jgi:hypothetical protein
MQLSAKALRTAERAIHLALGVGFLALAFTPLGDGVAGAVLRFALAPLVVLTGLLMWHHGRVVRALRDANTPIRIK